MYEKYDCYDNVLKLNKKEIAFNSKIAETICFEKCVIVRTKYSIAEPTNNLIAFDFSGNRLWEIDDIIKPMPSQTVVSVGKVNIYELSVITFTGIKLRVEAHTGKILEREIVK